MDISNVGRILSGLPLEKLTREQENDCAVTVQRYATGQQRQDAIDLLVLHNMRDAFFYLRRCCRGSMSDGDLYSVCYAALSRSAMNFKPSRQSYFAFSKAYLRGQMLREFKKFKVVKRGEVSTLPTPQSLDGWASFFFCGTSKRGDWETESDVLQDLSSAPEMDAIHTRERMQLLAPVLKRLTKSETDVIQQFFGQGKTLDEIGKNRGVTRERIRQIKAKALRKLRQALYVHKEVNE